MHVLIEGTEHKGDIMRTEVKITCEDEDDEVVLRKMLSARSAFDALSDIADELFRPIDRHGYSDHRLSCFFEVKVPEAEIDQRAELVRALKTKFYEILDENNIVLD
jgi:hypothetical protein